MKKYITAISLQHRDLTPVYYHTTDSTLPRLLTAFPILQHMQDTVLPGEEIAVVALLVGDPAARRNFDHFCAELQALSAKLGFRYTLSTVEKPGDETPETLIDLFTALAQTVADEDHLHACITFGTKPIPVVLTMALHYAYKIKKNVSVQAVVYGDIDWSDKDAPKGRLFDTTSLFYIDSMIDRIAALDLPDPGAALRLLLEAEE